MKFKHGQWILTRSDERRLERGRHKRARERFREKMFHRDEGKCRCCGAPLLLKSDNLYDLSHVHEILSRAQGGSDLDSTNCVCLCFRCHLRGLHRQMAPVAEWIVIVVLNPILGADDPNGLAFEPWIPKAKNQVAS